jgi:hypothetical protein
VTIIRVNSSGWASHLLCGAPRRVNASAFYTNHAPEGVELADLTVLGAAETRAFLTERGVDLGGEQETKTRKALEFFSGQLKTTRKEAAAV